MPLRDGTLELEFGPSCVPGRIETQSVGCQLEAGWSGRTWCFAKWLWVEVSLWERLRSLSFSDPRPCYGVEQFPAILAVDGLHEVIRAPVESTGHFRPVTAPGALKPVGLAHAISVKDAA